MPHYLYSLPLIVIRSCADSARGSLLHFFFFFFLNQLVFSNYLLFYLYYVNKAFGVGGKRHSNRQQQTVLSGIADWNLKVTGRGAEPGKERRRGKTERREKSGQHNSLDSPGSGCVAHSLCYFVRAWKCEWEVFKASPCRRILQSHPALCISSIYRHFPLHTPVVSLSFFLSATSRTAACPPHLHCTVVTSLWRYHSSSLPNFFHHHPSTADTSILAKHDLIPLTLLNLIGGWGVLVLSIVFKQGPRLYVFFTVFLP